MSKTLKEGDVISLDGHKVRTLIPKHFAEDKDGNWTPVEAKVKVSSWRHLKGHEFVVYQVERVPGTEGYDPYPSYNKVTCHRIDKPKIKVWFNQDGGNSICDCIENIPVIRRMKKKVTWT